jgi:excisionase family DNA binding protein
MPTNRNTRLRDVPLPSKDKENLTRLEACRVGSIGTTTFYKAVKSGRLKIKRNGTKIIVMRSALNEFIRNLPDG